MDHRVYPSTYPSAPPATYSRQSSVGTHSTSSTIAIQMPDDRDLKKEQESSLMMHANESGDAVARPPPALQQKDFVYKMPEPLPADHPSVYAARRRRGGCCCGRSCCCCLCIICAVLACVVLVLGIAALVAYLVLQPKTPDFSVTDATVTSFILSAQPTTAANAIAGVSLYLNADVTFNVTAENPNKKIGIYYDEVGVSLFYEDQKIGEGSIPAFYQGHRNTTFLLLHMQGEDVGLTTSIGSALKTSLEDTTSTLPLRARTMATVRIKIGSWKSGASKFQVDCDVEMSNPTAPNPRLLSKSCSFKVKKIAL